MTETLEVSIDDLMLGSFNRMMRISKEQQIASIRSSIDQQSREYESLFRNLVTVSQQIESDKGRIKVLMSREGENSRDLWDQIAGLDAVEKLVIDYCQCGDCERGVILVYTKPMWCVDDRTNVKHRVGSFRIQIDLHHRTISWYNTDYTIKAYDGQRMQAPHVFNDGHACMGSSRTHFETLLGYRDIYQLIILGLQFVESVNTNDAAGRHVDKWPYEVDGVVYYYPTITFDPQMRTTYDSDPAPLVRSGWVEKTWATPACTCPDCVGGDHEDYEDDDYDEYDEEENYPDNY